MYTVMMKQKGLNVLEQIMCRQIEGVRRLTIVFIVLLCMNNN